MLLFTTKIFLISPIDVRITTFIPLTCVNIVFLETIVSLCSLAFFLVMSNIVCMKFKKRL